MAATPREGAHGKRQWKQERVFHHSPAPFSALHTTHMALSPKSPLPAGGSKARVLGGAPFPLEGDPLGLHVGGELPPPSRLLSCTAGRWGRGWRADPGL